LKTLSRKWEDLDAHQLVCLEGRLECGVALVRRGRVRTICLGCYSVLDGEQVDGLSRW
jgi:hypothetical protein